MRLRTVLCAQLVALHVGCLSVVSRPMRTVEGAAATLAAGPLIGGNDSQTCYETCKPAKVVWPTIANNDARYGAMLNEHVGVSGGGALSANGGRKDSIAAWLVGYGQLTLQNDYASLAAGTELGINVISPFVGGDVQPFGPGPWLPNVSIYGRYSRVFSDPGRYKTAALGVGMFSSGGSSKDGGVAVRCGPLVVQYAYFQLETGQFGFGIIEGSSEASSWHVLLFGIEINKTVPWFNAL